MRRKGTLAVQHENLENGKTPVTRKPLYAFPNISSSLLTPKGTIFLSYVFVISLPFFIVLSPMNCLILPPLFLLNLTTILHEFCNLLFRSMLRVWDLSILMQVAAVHPFSVLCCAPSYESVITFCSSCFCGRIFI